MLKNLSLQGVTPCGGRKRVLGALRDHAPVLLGDSGIDVQHGDRSVVVVVGWGMVIRSRPSQQPIAPRQSVAVGDDAIRDATGLTAALRLAARAASNQAF